LSNDNGIHKLGQIGIPQKLISRIAKKTIFASRLSVFKRGSFSDDRKSSAKPQGFSILILLNYLSYNLWLQFLHFVFFGGVSENPPEINIG
jgi:hypothetical protein